MRQERITKKSRRRTTRQDESVPLVLPECATNLSDAEALVASIDQLVGDA